MHASSQSQTKRSQVTRRGFLSRLGAASSGGAILAVTSSARADATASAKADPIVADVLVVGGGTAGTIAAIQAGRLGARTVLVEVGSQLGGTTSTAGVDFPGLFHAWGRQVIAGIGWELVQETARLNGDQLPDFTVPVGRQHWRHQVRICGALYAVLAEEACLKAGVQLRHYEFPLAVEEDADGWKTVLAGKGTRVEIRTRQIVDCSGDASVVGLLGLPRRREAVIQPGTLIYRLGGWRIDRNDSKVFDALQAKADEAVREGRLLDTDFNGNLRSYLAAGGQNAMHVPGADSSSSVAHTRTNSRGRQSFLRMLRFLKSQPGFENLRVERLQPETGVRETYRIYGETTVTRDDYVSGRLFPDAVAYSFYPIDLHEGRGVRPEPLAAGVVPVVPLGALIPKGVRNLLVAGRCLSSDRLANSALRVQASCMAMGQAAGAAAALAARYGATAPPLERIRQALTDHGAVVPSV